MNWADYAILVVTAVSVVIGLFRGFVREVMALAVWLMAFWVAFAFADNGALMLEGRVDLPSARIAIAFAGLFIATLIVGGLINFLVAKMVDMTGLSGSDRFLGLFFGAARAVVLITAVVMVAGLTPIPRDPWWGQSVLLPRFQSLAEWAAGYLPDHVRDYFDFELETLQDSPAVEV